jgi:hypothetical protein
MAIRFDLDMPVGMHGTFEALAEFVRGKADGRRVRLVASVRRGPGGGNPNFAFEADDEAGAFGLVEDLYGPEDARGDETNRFYVYGEEGPI